MKILLINPSRSYWPGSKGPRLGLPLGLLYIAAVLEKNNFNVKIFDSLISKETKITPFGEEIKHGVSDEYLSKVIKEQKPDVVGISNQFTSQIDNATLVSRMAKRVDPKIITVIGGPHISVKGEDFLRKNKDIDIGVIGEGEYTFLKIIQALKEKKPLKNIGNIIYRDFENKDKIYLNEFSSFIQNLDELPFPAYHLIDMERYFYFQERGMRTRLKKVKRLVSLITSRGCPYNCIFCSIHLHMGKIWRAHSPEYVLNHIEYLIKEYQVKYLSFEDDNFTFNIKRCEEILDGLIQKKYKIRWDTPNGVRADRLTESLIKKMKEAGCRELVIGIESGDQEVLDKIINKNLRLTSVIETAAICKKINLPLRSFFVIGFPGEKKENILKTINFAIYLKKKFNVIPGLMIATPLFGTRLYKICQEKGYLIKKPDPKSLSLATQVRGEGLIQTEDFNPQDLKKYAEILDQEISKVNFKKRLLNPLMYFNNLKLLISNPLKTIRYLRRVLF